MAYNNELAIATMILADAQKTGTSLTSDQIDTLCNMHKVSADIVKQIMTEATKPTEVEQSVDFATKAVVAINVSKSIDADDPDLKEATLAYIKYTEAVKRLIDKNLDKVSEMTVGIQQIIDKLKNPEM